MARKSRQQRKAVEREAKQRRTQAEFQRAQKMGVYKMDTVGRGRLISRLVDHGATEVEIPELFEQSQVIWRLAEEVEVSETCVSLEEFMSNASRNAQSAINVIARMEGNDDHDLVAAMKKYVEDTGQSIKEVDDRLKKHESSLSALFSEIPDQSEDEVSWRNLIGRRNVIAHNLVTVQSRGETSS